MANNNVNDRSFEVKNLNGVGGGKWNLKFQVVGNQKHRGLREAVIAISFNETDRKL
jgi:hypothetical protein